MKLRTKSRSALEIIAACGAFCFAATTGLGSLNAHMVASSATQDIGLPIGTPAPPAMVSKLDGTPVDLASYYGKQPVLIEFWASWCEQCKALEPAIKSAAQKYGKDMKFVAVAVTVNQSLARAKAYQELHKLPMDMLWDGQGKAGGAFEVPATSYVVIVKDGKIAYGGLGSSQRLDAAIAKVLGR